MWTLREAYFKFWKVFVIGDFRFEYEYEIEYEDDFPILVLRLHVITTVLRPFQGF